MSLEEIGHVDPSPGRREEIGTSYNQRDFRLESHEPTLQDLRTEAKDIVDHHDSLIRILRAVDIGLVPVDLLIRSFGSVLGLDGWESAACC